MSNKILTAQKMGLDNPFVARGLNSHEPIRQCTLALDGPAKEAALYAHDLAIVDAMTDGTIAFDHVPEGADLAATGNALKEYAVARGATISETGADAIVPALTFLRERIFLCREGAEHPEMPLVTDSVQQDIDGSNDNMVQMKNTYIKGVHAPGVKSVEDVTLGGFAAIVVNDLTGEVSLGAAGTQKADHTAYEISGTTVINAYSKTSSDGNTYICIDVQC